MAPITVEFYWLNRVVQMADRYVMEPGNCVPGDDRAALLYVKGLLLPSRPIAVSPPDDVLVRTFIKNGTA